MKRVVSFLMLLLCLLAACVPAGCSSGETASAGDAELSDEELMEDLLEPEAEDGQSDWPFADTGIRAVDPIDPDVINILLVGADIRDLKNAMYRKVSSHADTVMMVSINKRTDTVTLVSFMRDSYVQIRGL